MKVEITGNQEKLGNICRVLCQDGINFSYRNGKITTQKLDDRVASHLAERIASNTRLTTILKP